MAEDRIQVQVIHHKEGQEWLAMPVWPPQCVPVPAFLTSAGTKRAKNPSVEKRFKLIFLQALCEWASRSRRCGRGFASMSTAPPTQPRA
jgi:hypothetical protein